MIMSTASAQPSLFGLAASFETPEAVLVAAVRVREAGYTAAEAYTPFPVKGLSEALGFRRTGMPRLVLIGGAVGCLGGYFMLWYANVISLPWNIGGKPPHSWPAFIPIAFEMTILGAALMAVLGMLALNGLPEPYHPMFKAPTFELASESLFFLCIESRDPKFDVTATREFLEALSPLAVMEVPR
jgi:hypothetical protein